MVLFGLVAERLGFIIEAVQAGFPDCQAKRETAIGSWQNVNIEFEFESRNFRDHGHAPEGCDYIVCWRHNWPECPEELKVIALGDEIKKLNHETRLMERQRGGGCKHEEHEGLKKTAA